MVNFFFKAFLLFVAWKVLYLFWLEPKGILDTPLTHAVGSGTVAMLNLFPGGQPFNGVQGWQSQEMDGGEVTGAVTDIYRGSQETLRVANACNGLELMVLYIGFLYCYPGRLSRRLWFALGGMLLIFVVNLLRCSLLVWIFLRYRKYLDFSHHFFFTFLVYVCIFLLWWRYTLKPRQGAVVSDGRPSVAG